MIDAYLSELAHEARQRGVEPSRLVAEVREHLVDAAAHAGGGAEEVGSRAAIAAFGGAALIAQQAAAALIGGSMRARICRYALLCAVAGSLGLLGFHLYAYRIYIGVGGFVITRGAPELAHEIAAIALLAVIGVAVALGIAMERRLPLWIRVGAFLGIGTATWAVAVSALESAPVAELPDLQFYLALALVVLIGLAIRRASMATRLGLGLVAAGYVGLALMTAWAPLGGVSTLARANVPLIALTAGITTLAVIAWRESALLVRTRVMLGERFEALGQRLARTD